MVRKAGETPRGNDLGSALVLGAALYQCRLEQGLSLRSLARRLGLGSHSGLLDYERGHRIPPEYLLIAYEREFGTAAGHLRGLRARALRERAEALVGDLIDRYGVPPAVARAPGTPPLVGLVSRLAHTLHALPSCMASAVTEAWQTSAERPPRRGAEAEGQSGSPGANKVW
ncbi:helix-turn-helix transcriptional regulator [Streptomyces sp. P17]|uniref:helix-turn-helix domain-containing protein n=1 Tax=Streptomyces sp. P17 TaxID=3074716 RepID=UPI0028F43A61|nr:helix-turn-helix transcriptional regulator [Streptomyces sp. P17]MDT9695140.1 helix-turn-helix transcriptional regulator [Streptomyces sp. P17]